MYTYYCKDSNCQGHTKSWERCCDMRAFSAQGTGQSTGWKQPGMSHTDAMRSRTPYYPLRKQVFA